MKPKAVSKEHQILTLAQAKALLEAARNTDEADTLDRDEVQSRGYFPLILLALTTGMREGELFALQWNQVNLDQGMIKVTHTLTKSAEGQLIRSEPKTDSSNRTIYLDDETIAVLLQQRKRQREAGYIGPQVFTSPEGSFVDRNMFRRRVFQPLLTAAELPPVTFHSLRHVANSLLAAKGVPLKVLQTRLGHSTSRTTFDVYSHIYEDSQRDATRALGQLFKGVSG